MPGPISDATLGNRFWIDTNLGKTGIDGPSGLQGSGAPAEASMVQHDSTITTFVKANSDPMAQNAINKAEIFAASHTLSDDEIQQLEIRASENKQILLGNDGAYIVGVSRNGRQRDDRETYRNARLRDERGSEISLDVFRRFHYHRAEPRSEHLACDPYDYVDYTDKSYFGSLGYVERRSAHREEKQKQSRRDRIGDT